MIKPVKLIALWGSVVLGVGSAASPVWSADEKFKEVVEGVIGGLLHKGVEPPKLIAPANGEQLTNYPRHITFKWEPKDGRSYDLQIDCRDCRVSGRWDSETGTPLHEATGLTRTEYSYVFVGDNLGRWRVRTTDGARKGEWSEWSYFSFNTGGAVAGAETGTPGYGDTGEGAGDGGDYTPQPRTDDETPSAGGYTPAGPGRRAGEDAYPGEGGDAGGGGYPGEGGSAGGGAYAGAGGAPPEEGPSPYDPGYDPGSVPEETGAPPTPEAGGGGAAPGRVRVVPYGRPRIAVPGRAVIKEDCVSFDPRRAKVVQRKGRWKIADGSHWVFDFGDRRNEATRALAIIRHYGANRSCFVGRPGPSLRYLLVDGRAPAGAIANEDCVPFNPGNLKVVNRGGRWKIADGRHWIFDFAGKRQEARTALAIIKHHGFNRSCFVGRPGPSFYYLRR